MLKKHKLDLNKSVPSYVSFDKRGRKYFCDKCQATHYMFTDIGQRHRDIIGNKDEMKRLKQEHAKEQKYLKEVLESPRTYKPGSRMDMEKGKPYSQQMRQTGKGKGKKGDYVFTPRGFVYVPDVQAFEAEAEARYEQEAERRYQEKRRAEKSKRIGKPYSQQKRQHGKGAGKVVEKFDLPDWDEIEMEVDDCKARGWDSQQTADYVKGVLGGRASAGVDVTMNPNVSKQRVKAILEHKREIDSMVDQVVRQMEDDDMEKAIGKPYAQQMGRKHGKGAGHITDGKKNYKVQHNIGRAKYVLSFHDGKKKHPDGSDFYDIAIFHNKKDLDRALNKLGEEGYVEQSGLTAQQEDQMLEEGLERMREEREPDVEPDFDAMRDEREED